MITTFYQELTVDCICNDTMFAHDSFNEMDDNIAIAYWSKIHKTWILHKSFRLSTIDYNGFPKAVESKYQAAKNNQAIEPAFYKVTKVTK